MNLATAVSAAPLPPPRPLPPHLTPPARRLVRRQLPLTPVTQKAVLDDEDSPLVAAILAFAEGTADYSRR